jgi:hypothetical protein
MGTPFFATFGGGGGSGSSTNGAGAGTIGGSAIGAAAATEAERTGAIPGAATPSIVFAPEGPSITGGAADIAESGAIPGAATPSIVLAAAGPGAAGAGACGATGGAAACAPPRGDGIPSIVAADGAASGNACIGLVSEGVGGTIGTVAGGAGIAWNPSIVLAALAGRCCGAGAAFGSTTAPQAPQNFAVSSTRFPHFAQGVAIRARRLL